MNTPSRVDRAAEHLSEVFGEPPIGAIVLGSGGGPVSARWKVLSETYSYGHFDLPDTTVDGHAGHACMMAVDGQRVLVLSGRVHRYEGHSNADLLCMVRALHKWGVRRLVLTSAVGSLRRDLPPGSLVCVTDHINTVGNPLLANHAPGFPRFPDLSKAYTPHLAALFAAVAAKTGVKTHEGVYAMTSGPSYETPAEVRMLRMLGGDVVGMSMPTEVIGAAQLGLEVLGVAVVSNLGAGLAEEDLTHEEVLEVVGAACSRLGTVIEGVLQQW